MKKLVLICTVLGFGLIVNAQDKPAKNALTPEEKAQLKEMRKDLNLTDEQKAKMKEIHKEAKMNREALKAMPKDQRKATMLATKAKVDSVLNDEQDKKMNEIRKKRREFRKN